MAKRCVGCSPHRPGAGTRWDFILAKGRFTPTARPEPRPAGLPAAAEVGEAVRLVGCGEDEAVKLRLQGLETRRRGGGEEGGWWGSVPALTEAGGRGSGGLGGGAGNCRGGGKGCSVDVRIGFLLLQSRHGESSAEIAGVRGAAAVEPQACYSVRAVRPPSCCWPDIAVRVSFGAGRGVIKG
jgi:hypothetical protein